MAALGSFIIFLLDLYIFVIIASVVVSWLIAFEVINVRNKQAVNIVNFLKRATEPVYRPVRKLIPPIAGIDLTPLVVIIGIMLLQQFVFVIFYR